ncbi:venom allergen 5 [Helicoverpa armigera]|uniref:venom allergen 5 n=1 Tax=Helicoverpa armigera TaxID=29058 RepID=UPI003083B5C7
MGLRVLFILSFIAIVQCKLVPLSCKQIRAFVDGHNSRRLQVAKGKLPGQPAASEMKMMVWDEELQAKASKWVIKNLNYHNPERSVQSGRFKTGENLYWYSTTVNKYELEPDSAIQSWFSENVNFTFGPLQPSDFDNSKDYDIGHYTQMVWANSNYLGCAISQQFEKGWNKFFVACNYGPGGNYLGKKPYKPVSDGPSGKLTCGAKNCDHPYGPKCRKL